MHEYGFPEGAFDLVLGVFCLCYLDAGAIRELLDKCKRTVKAAESYLLFMEPVTPISRPTARQFEEAEQRMTVRPEDSYKAIFRQAGWTVQHEERHIKEARLAEDLCTYVLSLRKV